MDKPLVIKRKEFIEKLNNLLNESSLPAFVLEPIIKDVYSLCKQATNQELAASYAQYAEALKKETEKTEEKEEE